MIADLLGNFGDDFLGVLDRIAARKLVSLAEDVAVLVDQHGLGRGGATVDADEAFDHLSGREGGRDEFLLGVAALEVVELFRRFRQRLGAALLGFFLDTAFGDVPLQLVKVVNVGRVAAMMREHAADLGDFMTVNPKGQQLPGYLEQLARHLVDEHNLLLKEIEFVKKKIDHIKEIVAMQQDYAKVGGVSEVVRVTDLVEDALQMNADALGRHNVEVVREYEPRIPEITVEKHKVLQVLVNLVRNAKYACDESSNKEKRLTVRISNGDDRVRIIVSDNGVGIAAQNLTKIFNHGFTTRKDGHGFGLHSGALTAKDLGGALRAHSDGLGKGATFTLELPCIAKER